MSIHWDPGLAFTAGSEEALRAGCLHGCVMEPRTGRGLRDVGENRGSRPFEPQNPDGGR